MERYDEKRHGDVNHIFRKDRRDLFGSGLIFLVVAIILLIASIIMFSLNDFNFRLEANNSADALPTGIGYFLLFAFFFPGIAAVMLFPKGVAFRRALKNKDNWKVTTATVTGAKRFSSVDRFGDNFGFANSHSNQFHNVNFRQTVVRYRYTDEQGRLRRFKVRVRFNTTELGVAGDEVYLALSGKTPIVLLVKKDDSKNTNLEKTKTKVVTKQNEPKQSIGDELFAMREYLNDLKEFGLEKSNISPLENETPEQTLERDIRNTELFILHLEMKDGDVESKMKLEALAETCEDAKYYLDADII